MTLFGQRDLFGLEVDPLPGPPPEADPAAAATWCALRIWADGRNLTAHTRKESSTTSEALHWPAAYLARWFVRSWPGLWERAGWPLPGSVLDAGTACRRLDRRLAELGVEVDDDFLDQRDAFVASHSLLAAAAGGVMPDIYLMREGPSVHVTWHDPSGTTTDVAFHDPRGHAQVPAGSFLEAVRGFLGWCREAAGARAPDFAREIERWRQHNDGPEAARAILRGYIFPWGARQPPNLSNEVEEQLGMPRDWSASAALLDPSRHSPAVVFRALAPIVTTEDVLAILDRLRTYPRRPEADRKLRCFEANLVLPSGSPPHEQGYSLAEQFREALDNPAEPLDVEALLQKIGVDVDDVDLGDPSVDGATVWTGDHGPVILVNARGHRTEAPWARRMTLAHELCHLLVDRSVATELMVASTPWAPPELERRANAFAAELLLPKAAILRVAGDAVRRGWVGRETRDQLMERFGVGSLVCDHQLENRLAIDS